MSALFRDKTVSWVFAVLVVCLLGAGCASNRPRPQPGQVIQGNPTTGTPPQYIPPQSPLPPPVTAIPMGPAPIPEATGNPMTPVPPGGSIAGPVQQHSNEPHVALVVGGAGIASFATVGFLKRFQEEGITVDFIVASGWPTLFSLGYGFLRSVNDLEWFAMRLQEKDFNSGGLFEMGHDYTSPDRISGLIDSSFPEKDLSDSRIPVIISATNTELGDGISEKGDWKTPLLQTMSVPGLYRPYPQVDQRKRGAGLTGIDVEEALKRGARFVIAIDMYGDYLRTGKTKKEGDASFRVWYLNQLRKSLKKEMPQALLSGRIVLDKAPTDFAAKRLAIYAGYKEAARLAKQLRSQLNEMR